MGDGSEAILCLFASSFAFCFAILAFSSSCACLNIAILSATEEDFDPPPGMLKLGWPVGAAGAVWCRG